MKRKTIKSYVTAAVLSLGLVAGLSGCKESERDRILMYKKGTYLGPSDQMLDDDAVRKLQSRTLYQIAA